MIVIYGPAGSGKSTQAELLAKKLGRVPMSMGQICREEFEEYTKDGSMVPVSELVKAIMRRVREVGSEKVVLDGQPWDISDFPLMMEAGMIQAMEAVVVLDVPQEVCLLRLSKRGRSDDRLEVWKKKLEMFEQKIYSLLTEIEAQKVPIFHVDGSGKLVTWAVR